MADVFKYDTLDILNKADKGASDWWANTLDNAKKRTDMDQTMFENAFKNDKTFQTHGSDVFKTNADNVYLGTKANYNTLLEPDRYNRDKSQMVYQRKDYDDKIWQVEQARTDDNLRARSLLIGAKHQDPAALLLANQASAGIADVEQAARAGRQAAEQFPGALGTTAVYGRGETNQRSLNLANDIETGNFSAANEGLKAGGFDMKIIPAPGDPTRVVVVNGKGQMSQPLNPAAVASQFRDRTGAKQGQAGAYLNGVEAEQRKYEQQLDVQASKNQAAQQRAQMRWNSDRAKALRDAAEAETDPVRKAELQAKHDELVNTDTFVPPGSTPGVASSVAAPSSQDMRSLMAGGAPTAPAPAAPAAPAARPAAATVAAPAPYTPPAAQRPPEPPRTIKGSNGFPVLNPAWIEWAKATGYNPSEGAVSVSELVRQNTRPAQVNSQYLNAAQNWSR